jgi:hypothetical protein
MNKFKIACVIILTIIIGCTNVEEEMANWDKDHQIPCLDSIENYSQKSQLLFEINDYIRYENPISYEKFRKYCIDSMYEYSIRTIANDLKMELTKDEFYNTTYNYIKQGRETILSNGKQLEYKINILGIYQIVAPKQENIKIDSTLYCRADVIIKIKNSTLNDSIKSELICLKSKTDKNWKFLDKEGCKEILTCEYPLYLTNKIMDK